jgi:putative protease
MGHHRCELLVPAGGRDQFIAAVENGADAVYIGGHLFNARINAGNFDDEELQAAVDFAHKRGVKVYVTMNTLLTDEELNGALHYAGFLYEAGVDGLIIQDLGLGRLVREYMPDFPLHLSTQATVYDLRGVETAARLGYERVVLARELSLAEIKDICRNTETEIEVFVHGALCICYSGQCQLSRYFGGRSGNRGRCAQPCRLPYRTSDSAGKPVDTFRYPLSPKDQCLIRELGSLAEAGVLSLKIEGRMKSAEYVAVVTSIYRKYLDLYYEKGSYTVSDEDLLALTQIFNRGGFTDDYLRGEDGMDLMSGELPKHQGVRIGKVIKRIQGTALLDVKLYDELALGDGVEIQGRELTGNVVTYYKELKGGLTRIGDIKGRVSHGDPLFRITSKAQLDEARRTYQQVDLEQGKYLRRTAVDMRLTGTGGRLEAGGAARVGHSGGCGGGTVPGEQRGQR